MITSKCFVFRFSDVQVYEDELKVTRGGQRLEIEPKAFRVLAYLLKHAGHLVSKSELMDAVWGETAVTENSLTRAIALLRRVLEDDPHQPHFIETVSTAGYRFICPVEIEEVTEGFVEPRATSANRTAPAPPIGIETKSRLVRRTRWALATITAGVFLAAGAFVWYVHQPLAPPHIKEIRKLTHDVRWRYKRSLGVEGGRVYFTGIPRGLFAVGNSGDVETILRWTFDAPAAAQQLSPDGGYFLGLFKNGLWVFSTTGKQVRFLADGVSAAWSPDGKRVIYSTENGEVYTIPSAGGASQLLLRSSPGAGDFSFSPDGKRIRFTTGVGPVWADRIWEISSDGSNLHEFLPGMKGSVGKCCGRWTPDGAFYIFASAKRVATNFLEDRQLWAVDERSGKLRSPSHDPVQLTFDPMQWTFPVISKDSRTIFATGILNQGELVRFDPRTGQYAQYMGGLSADWLSFSRDGKYVAYVSYPDRRVWRANRDGSDRILLAEPEGAVYGVRWSPDGTRILFCVGFDVYVVSSEGGRPERVQFPQGENPGDPTWSVDGRRLAYSVDPIEHVTQLGIRILDLKTHHSSPLPEAPKPVWSPRWSPDGRYIFCFAAPSGSAVYDTESRRWSQFSEKIDVGYMNWSRDSRSVYFLGGPPALGISDGVYRISIPDGHIERVIDLTNFRFWGSIGTGWLGLDPEDRPLLVRDVGTVELYALTLERK